MRKLFFVGADDERWQRGRDREERKLGGEEEREQVISELLV